MATPHSCNPFERGELKSLLDELTTIDSNLQFRRWKRSFLLGYEKILDVECVAAAEGYYSSFAESVAKLLATVTTLQEFIDKGDLSEERCTVKARKCVAESGRRLEDVIEKTVALMPGTVDMEREWGYTKFHMGALLIRDGFQEYSHLAACADILEHMRKVTLVVVADKQILERMDDFRNKVDVFCDVMADLGLYDAMMTCNELNQLPYEETPSPTPPPSPPPEPQPEPEPAPKPKVKKKKKEKDEEPYNPMTFTLSFPAPKPPTSKFIKLVERKDLRKKKGATVNGDESESSEDILKPKATKAKGKKGGEYDDQEGSIPGMQWDFNGSVTNLCISLDNSQGNMSNSSPKSPNKKSVKINNKKKGKKKAPVRQDSCSSSSSSSKSD
jgi:hypothetical protein